MRQSKFTETQPVSVKGFTPKACAKFVLKIFKKDSIH